MHTPLIPLLGAATVAFAGSSERIRVNQIGYAASMPKYAISLEKDGTGSLVDSATGNIVFTGPLGNPVRWSSSGDTTRIFDFSSVTQEGTYYIVVGSEESWPVRIARNPYAGLARGAIKAFWYNRSSFALRTPWAGAWPRSAGHPDTAVSIHQSAASATRRAGSKIRSPGGWYDAGDYGKYVVNSGISTWTLLDLYASAPSFFDTFSMDVPSHQGLRSDLADEVLWNLRWMLSMQDPADGGVYHKLTTAQFSDFIMPSADKATRYVVQKSTAAALNLAGTAAYAARLFKDSANLPGLGDSCANAALQAWNWARLYPDSLYNQDSVNYYYSPAIGTGTYGDATMSDEFRWAAAELSLTTGQDSFAIARDLASQMKKSWSWPGWSDPSTLGWLSLDRAKAQLPGSLATSGRILDSMLLATAATIRNYRSTNNYHFPQGGFWWGGNSAFANNGILLWKAWEASGDTSYLNASLEVLDYLLGRNPTGYSFVTGFGGKSPMHPHHRISAADGVVAPVPGFLVGGPNSTAARDDKCPDYPSESSTATSVLGPKEYFDGQDCYASNEVAINWNAPLAWLAGMWAARLDGSASSSVKPRLTSPRPILSLVLKADAVEARLGGKSLSLVEILSPDGRILASVHPSGNFARIPVPRSGLLLARAVAHDGTTASARLVAP